MPGASAGATSGRTAARRRMRRERMAPSVREKTEVREFQDELLLGPGTARGAPGLDGQLLGEGSFDFECHILVI